MSPLKDRGELRLAGAAYRDAVERAVGPRALFLASNLPRWRCFIAMHSNEQRAAFTDARLRLARGRGAVLAVRGRAVERLKVC